MVQRLTYRRRHSYATKSNRVKKVKTPGGKLTFHYVAKKSNPAVDPMTKQILNGVPVLRPAKGKWRSTSDDASVSMATELGAGAGLAECSPRARAHRNEARARFLFSPPHPNRRGGGVEVACVWLTF